MPMLRMAIGALVALALDQFSKFFVFDWLNLASVHMIEVQPPYLVFVPAWNRGVNFGILGNYDGRWALVALSLGISASMAFWGRDKPGWLVPLAMGAIIGGALGNALDRVWYGAVRDFINMSCCGIRNPYSFNLADVAIFGGVAGLVVIRDRVSPEAGGPT